MALSSRGLPDQARRTVERTLALAEILVAPAEHRVCPRICGAVFMVTRDRDGCERMGERMVALAKKFDLP